MNIWEKNKNYLCNSNLAKARSIWVAGQDYVAAINAGEYLSKILPDAECYGSAQQLYKEIKAKIGKIWDFEMKQYQTEADLKKAKIQAFQAIGVAYGKGQQPRVTIQKTRM